MGKLVPRIDNSIRDPIIKYSSLIPDIISDAISGLNNRNYRAIVVLLDIEGKKSFTELRKKLNLKKNQSNKLTYWLDKLEEEGLVVNEIIKVPNKRESSFYRLSGFGKDLLDKIVEAYLNYVSPVVRVPKEEKLREVTPTSSGVITETVDATNKISFGPLPIRETREEKETEKQYVFGEGVPLKYRKEKKEWIKSEREGQR